MIQLSGSGSAPDGSRRGVVERSSDGKNLEKGLDLRARGRNEYTPTELLIGKVPYNGQPVDYPETGPVGECDFEFVSVYGE